MEIHTNGLVKVQQIHTHTHTHTRNDKHNDCNEVLLVTNVMFERHRFYIQPCGTCHTFALVEVSPPHSSTSLPPDPQYTFVIVI